MGLFKVRKDEYPISNKEFPMSKWAGALSEGPLTILVLIAWRR